MGPGLAEVPAEVGRETAQMIGSEEAPFPFEEILAKKPASWPPPIDPEVACRTSEREGDVCTFQRIRFVPPLLTMCTVPSEKEDWPHQQPPMLDGSSADARGRFASKVAEVQKIHLALLSRGGSHAGGSGGLLGNQQHATRPIIVIAQIQDTLVRWSEQAQDLGEIRRLLHYALLNVGHTVIGCGIGVPRHEVHVAGAVGRDSIA